MQRVRQSEPAKGRNHERRADEASDTTKAGCQLYPIASDSQGTLWQSLSMTACRQDAAMTTVECLSLAWRCAWFSQIGSGSAEPWLF